MFSPGKFRCPDSVNAPGYFWFLNDKMEEKELRSQIQDMARHGARTICPHPLPPEFRPFFMSQMSPSYLSEEYMKFYAVIADECAKLNLSCYLYDEGGWPSGGACGQVFASDPVRFGRTVLVPDGKGGMKQQKVPLTPGKAELPDILAPGAVEKFLELTHERYAAHIGQHFGKTFRFVFMDEPEMPRCGGGQLAWTKDFDKVFKKKKGYDITPYLLSILNRDVNPEAIQPRIDYYDVLADLMVERFMLPIRDWCRKHHLLSGGHMNGEDDLSNPTPCYGKILRSLRALDFPGVDMIWRQIWMGKRLHSFPKFASSVANQNGSRCVSGEMFGVYGNGLTFGQMQSIIDYFIVCGVNTFISCVRPYATGKNRMAGERPLNGPVNPQWLHAKQYHDYTARLSMLSSSGRPVVDTALLLDDTSFVISGRDGSYAEALREKIADHLVEQQCDFDYIDNDVLATAAAHGGKARIGRVSYSAIVIPTGTPLTEASRENIGKLRAKGVKVISQDEIGSLAPTLKLSKPDWRLRVRKHRLGGGDVIYFVFNASGCQVEAKFQAEEKASVARCDCETGRFYSAGKNGRWSHSFMPYRAEVFLVGPSAEKAEKAPSKPGDILADLTEASWNLRPAVKHEVGKKDYVITHPKCKALPAKLGDWSPVLGKDFSGEAVYTAEFDAVSGIRFLDLGKVCYSAEVMVNGKSAGIRLDAPYIFDIAGLIRPGKNRLEVHVINTLANAICSDKAKEVWKTFPFESPYDQQQHRFEKESIPSGLFGPAVLRG